MQLKGGLLLQGWVAYLEEESQWEQGSSVPPDFASTQFPWLPLRISLLYTALLYCGISHSNNLRDFPTFPSIYHTPVNISPVSLAHLCRTGGGRFMLEQLGAVVEVEVSEVRQIKSGSRSKRAREEDLGGA